MSLMYLSAQVQNRYRNMLVNVTNQYIQQGVIDGRLQTEALRGFDSNPTAFVNTIMMAFTSNRTPESLTDQELASRITDYINKLRNTFAAGMQYGGMPPMGYNPGYQNNGYYSAPMPSNVFGPQMQMGGYTNNYAVSSAPPAPMLSPLAPPPTPTTAPVEVPQMSSNVQASAAEQTKATEESEQPRQRGYRVPKVHESGNGEFKNQYGTGTVSAYTDATEPGKRLEFVTLNMSKTYKSPLDVLADIIRATDKETCSQKVVLAKYIQLKYCDVPYESGKKAFKDIKELVKNTPANGKHTYINKISDYLGKTYYQNDFVALESVFKDEFEMYTKYSAVFSSEDVDKAETYKNSKFEVRSLAEVAKILEPKSTSWNGDERFGSQLTRDRVSAIARDTILATAKDAVVVDPSSTPGLLDYLKVYGDKTTEDGFVVNDILEYSMLVANKSTKSIVVGGNKYTPEEACKAIMKELKKHTIIKLANRAFVYSTIPSGIDVTREVNYDNELNDIVNNYTYLMALVHNAKLSGFYHVTQEYISTMSTMWCVYGSDGGCIYNAYQLT